LNGVNVTSTGAAATLEIIDCKFANFTNDGILIQSDVNLTISNTYAVNNGHDGIEISGSGYQIISNTYAQHNGNDGIQMSVGTSYAGISNTIATNNQNNGFEFHDATEASLSNVRADANSHQGIYFSINPGLYSTIKNSEASWNVISDLTANSGNVYLINNNEFSYKVIINSGGGAAGFADGTNFIGDLIGTLGSQSLH